MEPTARSFDENHPFFKLRSHSLLKVGFFLSSSTVETDEEKELLSRLEPYTKKNYKIIEMIFSKGMWYHKALEPYLQYDEYIPFSSDPLPLPEKWNEERNINKTPFKDEFYTGDILPLWTTSILVSSEKSKYFIIKEIKQKTFLEGDDRMLYCFDCKKDVPYNYTHSDVDGKCHLDRYLVDVYEYKERYCELCKEFVYENEYSVFRHDKEYGGCIDIKKNKWCRECKKLVNVSSRHCEKCKKCVSESTEHCTVCDKCCEETILVEGESSTVYYKHALTRHCDKCNKCVYRSKYRHCDECGKCTRKEKHCEKCKKCVYRDTKHCDKCGVCVSKYEDHCDCCGKCIQGKESKEHCETCGDCFSKEYFKHCNVCGKCSFAYSHYFCDKCNKCCENKSIWDFCGGTTKQFHCEKCNKCHSVELKRWCEDCRKCVYDENASHCEKCGECGVYMDDHIYIEKYKVCADGRYYTEDGKKIYTD